MIIFDEYLYGEAIEKKRYIDDNHLISDCTYLARYLFECGEKEDKIKNKLRNILQESGIEDYHSLIEDTIKKSIKAAKMRKCRKFMELIFYKKEIEKIRSFQTLDIQKIAFSILALYKFFNSAVTASKSDIMRIVNVNYSGTRFKQIINILTNSGFIAISHVNQNHKETKSKTIKVGYVIKPIPDDEEKEFVIKDFRNIIGSFMEHIGNPTFRCSRCGGIFEKTNSVNSICKSCKKIKKIEKERERYKNKKE